MEPGRRWSHPSIPLVAVLLAALVFVASLASSGRQLADHARREAIGHRIGAWESGQALLEAARLRADLHRVRDIGFDALQRRFEILWSRILSLYGDGAAADSYPALAALHGRMDVLFAALDAMEADLGRLREGEAAALPRIDSNVAALMADLQEADRDLHFDRQRATEASVAGMVRLQAAFSRSAFGLVASAAVLCALLFWLWRRTRASLLAAEAAQARAAASGRLLRVVVDAMPAMVSAHDRDGHVVIANAALTEFHQTSESDVAGCCAGAMTGMPEDDADIAAALASGRQVPFREAEAVAPDGSTRTLLTTTAPVVAEDGAVDGVVRVSLDISERKAAERQIRYIAEHDSLTGLANRLLFTQRLNHALAEGGMVALHLVDLDDFKEVNDSLGHAAGDAVLMTATNRMRACLQPGEILARLGGDEFALIQPAIAAPAEAEATAARIVRALSAPYAIEGAQLRAAGSIGIAIAPLDGEDGPSLLQGADIALYHAKGAGRGQARRFSRTMQDELVERRRMETDLQAALARGELHFVYQPKFRLSDLAFVGCEALMRWDHPTRGAVPPSIFIPCAERAGLATRLAGLTLREAMRQQAAWRADGRDIAIAVNLSARHIISGEAPRLLRDALETGSGRPDRLEIEVTEDVFIRDPAAAAGTLSALRALGVRLALDDFGTGYASLGYLQQLPFDVIKLDRSFVAGLGTSARTERIVDAVRRIAHGLGARLVAEGVETALQLAKLRELGCDEGQGYLLGRPVAPEVLAGLCAPGQPGVAAADTGRALTTAA